MKLAIIFPGVGYHADKPLLYYSKKIAGELGYEIAEVAYGNFEKNIKGSDRKMKEAFLSAVAQTEEILSGIDFTQFDRIIFISKSVGTAVASFYAADHQIPAEHIYYTPVKNSFLFMKDDQEQPGIVFHGTGDSWVKTDEVKDGCTQRNLPLYIIEKGNHSLETGNVLQDIDNLKMIMQKTRDFLR